MRKFLKVIILMMVFSMGMVFAIPTVQAQTTTEETDEVVELESDNLLEELKDKITLGVIGFLSSTTFGAIAGAILYNLKKKALAKVQEAVDGNIISQDTANKATTIIELTHQELLTKVDDLDSRVNELLDKLKNSDDRVNELLDKYEERDRLLADLIEEVFDDD